MNKLYQKSEIGFAIAWIVAYVVLTSLADNLSESLGAHKAVTLALHLAMSAVLLTWMLKNGHAKKYGLRKPLYPAARFLFWLPLAIVASSGLWAGVGMNYAVSAAICHALSMLCVGFLEEAIFRGLLFRAMARTNLRSAAIVSSLTFGLGHIVNLVNGSGQSVAETLPQIVFAVAVGFALVELFYRGGSLIPCVVFHSLNNALNTFGVGSIAPAVEYAVDAALILLLASYALLLYRTLPEPEAAAD